LKQNNTIPWLPLAVQLIVERMGQPINSSQKDIFIALEDGQTGLL
jgi:hypothetical protein